MVDANTIDGSTISAAFPYQKQRRRVLGREMAYVEVGKGDPIVLLHGNPTSSYLWRNVLPHLRPRGRCIAPDLIGMGDSDKLPDSGPGSYRFVEHRRYLDALLEALNVRERVTLVVHDWGSALGFDWANRHREAVKGIAFMEAIVAPQGRDHWDKMGMRPALEALRTAAGETMVLQNNYFIEEILPNAILRRLSDEEMAAYRRPFAEPGEGRRPTLTWPRQIPIDGEPADVHAIATDYADWLGKSAVPKLFLKAEPGAILANDTLVNLVRSWPALTEKTVAGVHFVQEDFPDEIGRAIAGWMRAELMVEAMATLDVLILGSGQGGKLLAWRMARSGHRTAVVERQWVGGSCPAVACLPSKNEIWSARVAHLARTADQFGTLTGAVRTDMAKVRRRKQGMIDREIAFHLDAYKTSGAELIMGTGRFVGPRTIEAQLNDGGTRRLTGDRVFVNVGSHAAIPNVPGLAAARPLTHIEALELDSLPSHLIVLGGGYTGVELAQACRRFGSRVTIIDPGPHLMSREDPDVAAEMQRILRAEGIEILVGAPPRRVEGRSGERVSVTVPTAVGEQRIDGSDILVATGRIPNTAGIGLEEAGIALDARGFIEVNDRLETTAAGVWAIGECAGSPQFTHASVDDFRIVRDNLSGGSRSTKNRLMPYCVFTDPPLAHVGLSEVEARRQGIPVRIATLPMSRVLRTEATDETQGFMKVLVSQADDRILGFTMIGSEAGEVMAAVQTAMLANLPYPTLRDAVITHLTVAEGLGALLSTVVPRTAQDALPQRAAV